MDFGAFVTILPGKDGLVHVSQISNERVEKVSDKLKEGDIVKVKVLEVDKQGRIRLSLKAVDRGRERCLSFAAHICEKGGLRPAFFLRGFSLSRLRRGQGEGIRSEALNHAGPHPNPLPQAGEGTACASGRVSLAPTRSSSARAAPRAAASRRCARSSASPASRPSRATGSENPRDR